MRSGPPRQGTELVLVDTAGRLPTKQQLDEELAKGAAHHSPAGAFGGVESLFGVLMPARVRMACARRGLFASAAASPRGAHQARRQAPAAAWPWRWLGSGLPIRFVGGRRRHW